MLSLLIRETERGKDWLVAQRWPLREWGIATQWKPSPPCSSSAGACTSVCLRWTRGTRRETRASMLAKAESSPIPRASAGGATGQVAQAPGSAEHLATMVGASPSRSRQLGGAVECWSIQRRATPSPTTAFKGHAGAKGGHTRAMALGTSAALLRATTDIELAS